MNTPLSTKNVDKAIRTFERINSGLKVTAWKHCRSCKKKIKDQKKMFITINPYGFWHYYHLDCLV